MSTQIVIPEHELPTWMKRARLGFDWGMMLVIGFCLLIAWQFIENPGLPRTNDSIHYAFQAHDAAQSLREGRLYPRWSPYTLNNLGAPIPHYTPPGATYITALIEVLFTNDTVFAMRIVHTLALVAAGVSVYALVMQRVNAMAGVVAAMLYVYSPYLSLTVPHVLGDLPEAIALALLPMLLWAVHRTLYRHKTALLYLPLMSAILFLTSPQHFVLGWLLSGVLVAVHISEFGGWQQVRTIALALCMSFGVSAFYWLPAVYERNLVHWLPVSTDFPHYRLAFMELFARTHQLDSGAMRHIPTFNLGWMLLLACWMSIILFLLHRGTRFQLVFFITGVVLTGSAIFAFVSMTWLLGGIVLCLAIGSSVIGNSLERLPRWIRYPTVLLLIIIIFWLSLPIWLSQSALASIISTAPIEQMNYEARTGTIALLPPDMRYPTTLPDMILSTRSIDADFDPVTSSRFPNTSPAQLTLSEQGIHFANYVLFAEALTTVIYEQASFPGWMARLDKKPIPLQTDTESGLTQLTLPTATNSNLTIFLGTTPIRSTAWLVSAAMIAAAVFIVRQRWRRLPDVFDMKRLLAIGDVRLLAFILIVGIAARTMPAIADTIYQLRRPADYQLQNRAFANNSSDSHLEYQGYTLVHTALSSSITLSLYWEALRESSDLYEVAIRVRDSETNAVIYESDRHAPGFYPTALWTTNLYVEDRYQIQLPPNLTTDDVLVEVSMWRCETTCDTPINFYSPDRQVLGTSLTIPIRIQPD
jgi:hypothetical protein